MVSCSCENEQMGMVIVLFLGIFLHIFVPKFLNILNYEDDF